MKKHFIPLLLPIALSILTGCNSSSGESAKAPEVPGPLKLESISVFSKETNRQFGVFDGSDFYVKAIGHFSDGSQRDITDTVKWETSDEEAGDLFYVASDGLILTRNKQEAAYIETASISASLAKIDSNDFIVRRLSLSNFCDNYVSKDPNAAPLAALINTGTVAEIESYDTSSIKDMTCLFSGIDSRISDLDLTNWDTSNVVSMDYTRST